MKVVIVDNNHSSSKRLKRLLKEIYKTKSIEIQDPINLTVSKGDLVIFSGGHGKPVPWHHKEYKNEFDLILSHEGPIIGICLGFDLIIHAFSNHLSLDKKRYISKYRRTRYRKLNLKDNSGFTALNPHPIIVESHNWYAKTVKYPLKTIAVSSQGVEIFRHISKPIYGIQFHPESKKDKGDGKAIFKSILLNL